MLIVCYLVLYTISSCCSGLMNLHIIFWEKLNGGSCLYYKILQRHVVFQLPDPKWGPRMDKALRRQKSNVLLPFSPIW
jgi:hypothetical protein